MKYKGTKLSMCTYRLPEGLRDKVKIVAEKEYKTVTAWFIEAILEKLDSCEDVTKCEEV